MRIEKKDLFLLIPATLLAIAGLGPDDPWVVGPCLIVSWITFIVICVIHEGSMKSRAVVALVITLALGAVAYRRFGSIEKADHTTVSAGNDLLVGNVEQLLTGGHSEPHSSIEYLLINVECTITNPHGPPTGARDWRLLIEMPDGQVAEGAPPFIASDPLTVPLLGYNQNPTAFRVADYLPIKTREPIPAGGAVTGWFWGVFRTIEKRDLRGTSAVLVIAFTDVFSGKEHYIRRPFSKPGRDVPGLRKIDPAK